MTSLTRPLKRSAIEALDHGVGLRVARRGQTMFDREFCAGLVEDMLTSGPLVFGCETVGESAAVVGQDFNDSHGCSAHQAAQEVLGAGLAQVAVEMDEHPAGGAINGHEQVMPQPACRSAAQSAV